MWRYVALCGVILRYQAQQCCKNTLFSIFRVWMWPPYVALSDAFPKLKVLQKKHKIFNFPFGCGAMGAMWRYVALSDAILKPKILQKTQNFQISEFGCGAMWRYVALSDAILKPKILQKTQNFQISEFGCGTMWRYAALSSNPKFCKKTQNF